MRLYVGNLPYTATDEDLRETFEAHGELVSTLVVMDRDTGRSRGFGFVEYQDSESARNAIAALDGTDMGGRSLRVNEAHERGGGRGGGGGGGGRY
jgi:RNA recognition motif-containing protein